MTSSNPMTSAPVTKSLLLMSAPISLGMLSTFLFQVVDTYFVGQLGSAELAALSFAATAYFLAVALFMGLAVGVSSLVGNALGKQDHALAQRYTSLALALAIGSAAILGGIGVVTIEPLFAALGAGSALIPLISEYMTVLYLGLPLLVFGLVGGAAIRASGSVKAPEIVMGLAGVVNVVLDYTLIFGVGPFPRLGLEGAALATVSSWAFAFVCMAVLLGRRRMLTTSWARTRATSRDILHLSTPAIATQVLLPITAMFVTFLAARSGPEVVAAFGVAARIETLLLVGISSVSVAVVPFIAQNHGASEKRRVEQAIVFAGKASVYWGAVAVLVLVLLARPIAGVFSDDPAIVHYTSLYFYIVAGSYGAYGIVMVTAAIFNGVLIPGQSLKVLLVKTFALTVPMAAIGSLFGAAGVFGAICASNLLGAVYAARQMRRSLAEHDSDLAHARPLDDYLADWRALARRVAR